MCGCGLERLTKDSADSQFHTHKRPTHGPQPHPLPPLKPLSRKGHLAAVRELLADAGRRNAARAQAKDGSTALHIAAAAGHADVARALLDAGARVDVHDRVRRGGERQRDRETRRGRGAGRIVAKE